MNATDQVFLAVVVFIVVKDIDDFRSSSLVPESPVLLPALIFVEPRRSRLLPGHGQQTVFSLKSFFVGVDRHGGQEREAEAANDSVKKILSTKKITIWGQTSTRATTTTTTKEMLQQSCQTRTKLKWPNDDWLFAFMRVTQGLRLIGGPLVV